jgi:formamidopyrimidine-DNA glycosylase
MPELPDLEVIKEFLGSVLVGETVVRTEIRRPIVLRDLLGDPPGSGLPGRRVREVGRWGPLSGWW